MLSLNRGYITVNITNQILDVLRVVHIFQFSSRAFKQGRKQQAMRNERSMCGIARGCHAITSLLQAQKPS